MKKLLTSCAAIVAALAIAGPVSARPIEFDDDSTRTVAAWTTARAAVDGCATCPPAFAACVLDAGRVLTVILGVDCIAPDGEHWYAGLIDGRLETGP